jgi:hypothetical protein
LTANEPSSFYNRSAGNRQFFQIPLKAAIKALEDGADEIGRVDESATTAEAPTPPKDDDAPQAGEITALPSRNGRKISTQKTKPAVVTFDDHAAYTDSPRRSILADLRSRVLKLDDRLQQTERCTPGQRIAYSIPGGRDFLEVKVQRAAIVLHLADGGCPDTLTE